MVGYRCTESQREDVPSLRWLVASLIQQRPGFSCLQACVSVAVGQALLRLLQFTPVSTIQPVLHSTVTKAV